MDPLTIASLGVGALQTVQGFFQKSEAKKLAASNPRPVYNIQQPILDNQALAEAQAGQGLDSASQQIYSSGAERGLTASINAILQGDGSVNNIADLQGSYQGEINKLALVNAQARIESNRRLVAQNNAYAGELDKQFQVNQYAPYADRAQAAAALQTQGNNNLWKGINTAGNAFAAQQQSNTYLDAIKNVFGRTGQQQVNTVNVAGIDSGSLMNNNTNQNPYYNNPIINPLTGQPLNNFNTYG